MCRDFPITYPTIADVIALHAEAMRVSNEPVQGINSEARDRLSASLELVQDDRYYRSLDAKLTHILFSACKLHVFVEGNKRASLAVGAKFLDDNGFEHRVSEFFRYMEVVIVCVADNKISKEFLGEIVIAFLNEEESEEGLQLRILAALQELQDDQDARDQENRQQQRE